MLKFDTRIFVVAEYGSIVLVLALITFGITPTMFGKQCTDHAIKITLPTHLVWLFFIPQPSQLAPYNMGFVNLSWSI